MKEDQESRKDNYEGWWEEDDEKVFSQVLDSKADGDDMQGVEDDHIELINVNKILKKC